MNELVEYEKARYERKKRRVMRALKLEEISGVDQPAQVGATVTILKRHQRGEDAHSKGAKIMSEPKSFEEACERIAKRSPDLKKTECMTRARKLWPELLEKQRLDGLASEAMEFELAKLDLAKRHDPAVNAFQKRCDEVQATTRCSRVEALRKVAREMSPDEFESYRRVVLED